MTEPLSMPIIHLVFAFIIIAYLFITNKSDNPNPDTTNMQIRSMQSFTIPLKFGVESHTNTLSKILLQYITQNPYTQNNETNTTIYYQMGKQNILVSYPLIMSVHDEHAFSHKADIIAHMETLANDITGYCGSADDFEEADTAVEITYGSNTDNTCQYVVIRRSYHECKIEGKTTSEKAAQKLLKTCSSDFYEQEKQTYFSEHPDLTEEQKQECICFTQKADYAYLSCHFGEQEYEWKIMQL